MSIKDIEIELSRNSNKEQANLLQRFFKTGPGEYGEGDIFIGIKVPVLRSIAKKNKDTSYKEIKQLLKSKIHEKRLVSLMILIFRYQMADENEKLKIFNIYLNNTNRINNWDLIDLTAPRIIGDYLLDKDKSLLINLAKSKNLWERRIAVLSTFQFIKYNQFDFSLKISKILLNDPHDLIHKAVGWMLREIGKRNLDVEEKFLKAHYSKMPRTMLRYAIEKFPEKKRKGYLRKK
jgi:3-methyladenine DNA glycosylase AlkD